MKMNKSFGLVLLAGLCAAGLAMTARGQQVSPFAQNQPARNFYEPVQMDATRGLVSQNYYATDFVHGNNEADKLARDLAKAKTDGEKESITAKLRDALEKQFDQRQKKHQADAEALEAQVKKLKELIHTRSENRREIVSRRLEQVVREAQGLGW
jgi:hypothetical protein